MRKRGWSVLLAVLLLTGCVAGCRGPAGGASSAAGETGSTRETTTAESAAASETATGSSAVTEEQKPSGDAGTKTTAAATTKAGPVTRTTTTKTATTTEPENPNNKVSLRIEAQETDIVRQDADGNRRLVYYRIANPNGLAMPDCALYYSDGGKAVKREIGNIYINQKYVVETFWLKTTHSGALPATLKKADGTVLWEGKLPVVPAKKEYVVKRSKCYSLSDIRPGMLRGGNYFNRDKHWGQDWIQTDFTKEWEADFKEFSSKLHVNTVRAFTILTESQLELGQIPSSETLIKIGRFLEIADKYGVKVMFCLYGGRPLVSANMGENLRFVRGITEPFQNDGRILMWDLMNEPDDDVYNGSEGKGLGQGGYFDAFFKTLYPKLANEYAPHHMTGIGTGWQIDKLNKTGLTTQIGHYHYYVQSNMPAERMAKNLMSAADTYFNGKKGPFVAAEWGTSSERADGSEDEAYQDEMMGLQLQAYQKVWDAGYNLLGIYNWCLYDFPQGVVPVQRKHGLIRADGSLKPAAKTLAAAYEALSKKTPAPWDQ